MNSNLLKAKRVELGLLQKDVAKRLGISATSYSYKETGLRVFNIDEVNLLRTTLDLDEKGLIEIFFTDNVELNSTTLCKSYQNTK